MNNIYNINQFKSLKLWIKIPSLIFLSWDLWAGKTTLTKYIINDIFWVKENITSPTYIYYNKYTNQNNITIYHFDLYRLSNYDEFVSIWWEEILDNNDGIIIIEWPDIIKDYYKSDINININKTEIDNEREIIIL